MTLHSGYEPARSCTGGASPGCRALMAWYLGEYGGRGGVNTGIYNCRPVRGGGTWSLHAEGRACDLGVRPYSAQYGTDLAEQLRSHSGELGIQLVIWNRRSWSGSRPHDGWRPYRGVSPHTDHLHVELSRAAARTLTVDRVKVVLTGGGHRLGRPVLRPGSAGPEVMEVQRLLNITVDGKYGPATETAVRAFQRAHGLEVDGICGPKVWAALGEDDMFTDDDRRILRDLTKALDYRHHHGNPEDNELGHVLSIRKHTETTLTDIVTRLERVEARLPKAP